jgi:hypothetical protein
VARQWSDADGIRAGHDIHPERLGRWHRLLRAQPEGSVRFHPVRVREAEPRPAGFEKMELVLRDGRSIRCRTVLIPEI